jgi:Leucine-rich repeat (LRR) protein
MKHFQIIAILLLLMGCDRYQVTLNDREIYTPATLFTDYQIPDPGLNNCVSQSILDQSITRADQLVTLNCSYAGIQSLDGLKRFSSLRTLNLADNKLGDIKTLLFFGQLQQVDLRGNDSIACADTKTLADLVTIKLHRPENCLP